MTDVPDPQPPAPEASVDALVARAEENLNDDAVMVPIVELTASARDVLTLAARLREAERERDEARELNQVNADMAIWKHDLWKAEEARVRELEEALPLIRSELDWCIGYASTAEHEAWRERLLKRLHVARALLGSGEGQEQKP